MKAQLMGILNATPDSFFDGGRHFGVEEAIKRGLVMVQEGADILDIGGESTRPGAAPVPETEEIARVVPVIKELARAVSIPISIDTMKPKVAKAAVEAGASLINDVSGFDNREMIEIAASSDVKICVMHMKGTPQTMQLNPLYEEGVVVEIKRWFERKIKELIKFGVREENIILDPGIGFGKSVADNLKIIHNLPEFKELGFSLLLGVSRKSFLGKLTGKPSSELLPATIGINTLAVLSGVDFIRVHDVKEHRTLLDLLNKYDEI